MMTAQHNSDDDRTEEDVETKDDESRTDKAETPGTDQATHEEEDELVDEWGRESFPSSDPPAHY